MPRKPLRKVDAARITNVLGRWYAYDTPTNNWRLVNKKLSKHLTDIQKSGKKVELSDLTDNWDVDMEETKEVEVNSDGNVSTDVAETDKETSPEGPPLSKKPRTADALPTMDEPATMMSRSVGASTGNGDSGHETKPNYKLPRELGMFTETRTAILPIELYFTFGNLRGDWKDTSNKFKNLLYLRMNSPYNVLKDTTLYRNNVNNNRVEGLGTNLQGCHYNNTPLIATRSYPYQLQPDYGLGTTLECSSSTAYPAYLRYYQKIYEHYTVLETHYKITLTNCAKQATHGTTTSIVNEACQFPDGAPTGTPTPTQQYKSLELIKSVNQGFEGNDYDAAVVYGFDTYGEFGQNRIPNTEKELHLTNAQRWKGVHIKPLPAGKLDREVSNEVVIEGVWYPNSLRNDTYNEEEKKTWHATGSFTETIGVTKPNYQGMEGTLSGGEPTPAHNELLMIACMMNRGVNSNGAVDVQCKVDLSYHVQFRDLKNLYRYSPNIHNLNKENTLQFPHDTYQHPSGPSINQTIF